MGFARRREKSSTEQIEILACGGRRGLEERKRECKIFGVTGYITWKILK